jgi:hypothetical protein
MEVVVPLFALSSLYLINNQNKKKDEKENFSNQSDLPNTNVPDENYNVVSKETANTSELSVNNRYDNGGGVYTDKYFNQQPVSNDTGVEYMSLDGNKVGVDYFKHNNMVPFFGGNLKTSSIREGANESILDNTTGAGSQTIKKREQSPLFAPGENLQWAHGMPNQSDFIKSRINPSLKMSNVNPFKQESVAPGLGLGYTTEGSGGFNSGMEQRDSWKPKSVDELRVNNNPKSSGYMLYGHEGPANSQIKTIATREQMGVMEKHRPERSFELDQRNVEGFSNGERDIGRLFTTGGVEKGQTMRAVPVARHVSRPETAVEYMGAAGYQNDGTYVPGEYMESKNQQLGAPQFGSASAQGKYLPTEADYGIKSKQAYPNNRSANKQDSYFGLVSGSIGAVVAPLIDILRPSRKENIIGTLRPYQNPGTNVPQSYIFNPADKLTTTIRETTENSKNHLNINANQHGGAYQTTRHQVANTTRNETGDFYYAGVAGAGDGSRQPSSYEAGYNQRNNDIKSSTIDGYMVKGNMSLMNDKINVRQVSRDERLKNTRPVTGNMPYRSPDTMNMGRLSGVEKGLYSNIQTDRTNPEFLNNLHSNPYILDHRKGL